jgi:hypothetical protein
MGRTADVPVHLKGVAEADDADSNANTNADADADANTADAHAAEGALIAAESMARP